MKHLGFFFFFYLTVFRSFVPEKKRKKKNQFGFMWETEDGVELNCNMRGVIGSRGLRLFIIQYGWLSDEARGERERESEQKRSRWRYGALCSSPACWKCDFLFLFFFFFATLWAVTTLDIEGVSVVLLRYEHLFALMQCTATAQSEIRLSRSVKMLHFVCISVMFPAICQAVVTGEEVQTENCNIYNINEVMVQTRRYLSFP